MLLNSGSIFDFPKSMLSLSLSIFFLPINVQCSFGAKVGILFELCKEFGDNFYKKQSVYLLQLFIFTTFAHDMDKEQIKQYYRRFCHWQQAEPHYVNSHEDTVMHCHNCGTEFSDNFCPRCGQRAEVGRVGWNSIKDNVAFLWGMDSRSFTYTLFQLLTRPGYLVRDYISGRRQVSFPPVKMLVIVSLS